MLIFFLQYDLADLELDDDGSMDSDDSGDLDEEDIADPIGAERRRRAHLQDRLRRRAGEPVKPEVKELSKLMPTFLVMLRGVLAG